MTDFCANVSHFSVIRDSNLLPYTNVCAPIEADILREIALLGCHEVPSSGGLFPAA